MRISIVTIGTRGDVQPFIALALGLQAAGHQVTINTHGTFRTFVETHGIAFAPLAGDIRAILNDEAGRQLMAEANPLRAIRRLQGLAAPIIRQVTADILAATYGCDLILGSTLGYLNAVTAAEVHRVPLILAALQPFTPTSAYPIPLLTAWPAQRPFAGAYHRLSYHATYRTLQLVMAGMGNTARRVLTGLPPLRYADVFGDLIHARRPVIYGFSEHLVPRPHDYAATVAVTGFWFLDQASGWQPPADLRDFLAAGPAPVYVGFGSFGDGDPAAMARAVVDGLRQAGRRGLLLAGWQGLQAERPGDDILVIDGAPHDWLFAHMALVVHHGGAGTAAAALRAGVPQLVVPFSADQPFWADRVQRAGVGGRPLPRRHLRAETLAEAIALTVDNTAIQATVRRLGAAVRHEDGVGRAVEVIEGMRGWRDEGMEG